MISIEKLTRSYGTRRGIRDVSLSVTEGQIYGFLGPNGAGKSTTIRILLGFLKAESGSARIFGQECWASSDRIKQHVGYVAGDVRLYPWLTAERAFDIVGRIRNQDITTHGRQLAEQFRLEAHLPVRKMSRGNRQKLALVLALAHQPRLLVLDEPTSGLDPLIQDVLMDILRMVARRGTTVFFSSHTLSEVENICDHVAVIRDGRIVVDDSLTALQQRAPRLASLRFQDGHAPPLDSLPEGTTALTRHDTNWKLSVAGDSIEFSRWALNQSLIDFSLTPPRLEDLFRTYYDESKPVELQTADQAGAIIR